jgi:hypothetical protein
MRRTMHSNSVARPRRPGYRRLNRLKTVDSRLLRGAERRMAVHGEGTGDVPNTARVFGERPMKAIHALAEPARAQLG